MVEAKKLQHRITNGYIQIVMAAGNIPAYWAHPISGGPFPALVLLHDDRGLSAHARATAHRIAEVGYYVVVPDLFDGHMPTSTPEADFLETHYFAGGPHKVAAALDVLRSHHKSNNKMAVMGWDFGATLAFEIALTHPDVMAAIAFYGNPAPYLGRFDQATCPILALFGQHDEITRQYENKLREEWIRTGKPHEVIVYPDAQHHFYNDSLPQYQAEAAEDAWQQSLAFLETHQGRPPAPSHAQTGTFSPGQVY
jgi:carboxymethylenebutenolidase